MLMFQIEKKESTVEVYQENKLLAQVGTIGAILNAWSPGGYNVIEGYEDIDNAPFQHARSGWLFPFPNRLEDGRFEFGGKAYQFPINEPDRSNAIHGFLLDEPFKLYKTYNVSHQCILGFKHKYVGNREYFPFSFELKIDYHFSEGNLKINITIENIGGSTMPFAIGWHPYFRLKGQLEKHFVTLPPARRLELNSRVLPTGKEYAIEKPHKAIKIDGRVYDDCLHFDGEENKIILSTDTDSLTIELGPDWPFFMAFTPEERTSIALEPMTGSINCLNNRNGLKELDPGKTFQTSFVIKMS
jgi:aldose 1-epimerase